MLLTTNRLRLRIDCSARCVILFSVVFFSAQGQIHLATLGGGYFCKTW